MAGSKLRWFLIALGGVLFALTFTAIFDVSYYYFDEPIYIDATQSLANGDSIDNWEHPPLGKYFILAGRSLLNDKVAGARVPGLIALLVMLAFIGLIAERVFQGKVAVGLAGSLAILLTLTDPLVVNLSKVAMLEIYVLAFTTGGLFFTVRILQEGRRFDLIWLGIFCGLAVATKWSAIPIFAIFYAAVFYYREHYKALVSSAVLAIAIYAFSFAPYLWVREGTASVWDVIALHRTMLRFHKTFDYIYPHQSAWYSWPILYRPVWMVAEADASNMHGLFLVGNVLTYLIGPIGLVWYAYRRRGPISLLLIAGYLATFVFWAIAARPTYFYYYGICAPFIYLGALALLWQAYKRQPWLGYSLVALVMTIFALYYPIVRFSSMSTSYAHRAFFVPTWMYLFQDAR